MREVAWLTRLRYPVDALVLLSFRDGKPSNAFFKVYISSSICYCQHSVA